MSNLERRSFMYKKVEFVYKIEKGKKYYKKIVDLPKREKEYECLPVDRVKGAEDFLMDYLNEKEQIIKVELVNYTDIILPNSLNGTYDERYFKDGKLMVRFDDPEKYEIKRCISDNSPFKMVDKSKFKEQGYYKKAILIYQEM